MALPKDKLFIQNHAPSIPYKDSAFGYEPLDLNSKYLVNVGNSFKQTFKEYFDQTPGPGAYEIAQMHLKGQKNSKVLSYQRDASRRSDQVTYSKVGPGTYNTENKGRIGGKKMSYKGHSVFA